MKYEPKFRKKLYTNLFPLFLKINKNWEKRTDKYLYNLQNLSLKLKTLHTAQYGQIMFRLCKRRSRDAAQATKSLRWSVW